MRQKEAKIEALRSSVAWLSNMQTDYEDDFTQDEINKIELEREKICVALYKRAVRVGGDFNRFTGY